MIGYEKVGSGRSGVIVMNDWLCDTSTWDGARAYLDEARFSYAFADLRGYGRSKGQAGAFTVQESAADVLAVADALGWARFEIVGHSMSTLVAIHLAQHHAERIERAVLITPPPPRGFGLEQATLDAMVASTREPEAEQIAGMRRRPGGDRYSERWTELKVTRWRAAADPEAIAGYAAMFGRDGLPDVAAPVTVPLLAITGEQDGEIMRKDAVTKLLAPLCEHAFVEGIAGSGHYPMQETPPLLVTLLERFLAGD